MESVTIAVRVQPRSRRDEIVAVRDGVVVLRVGASPREGRANDAVRRLVASRLSVPTSSVMILRGQRTRDKLLRIDGVDQATVDAAFARE